MPSVEVDQYGAGAFLVLSFVEDVQYCSLTPDVLRIPYIIQIAKSNLPKLHFPPSSPFLHFPSPLAVTRVMLGQAELNSPPHVTFQQGADNDIAAFDVFPAARAKVGEVNTGVEAFVAEGVSAGGEDWTHQQFQANGTDEFVSVLLTLDLLEVSMEVYIKRCLLSTFRLYTSPSADLKILLPSAWVASPSFSLPLTRSANLLMIIGILLLTKAL